MTNNIDLEIKNLNQKCMECQREYQKLGLFFDTKACKNCEIGNKLHKLEMQTSKAEQDWGKQDWQSSKLERYYHG